MLWRLQSSEVGVRGIVFNVADGLNLQMQVFLLFLIPKVTDPRTVNPGRCVLLNYQHSVVTLHPEVTRAGVNFMRQY